MAKKSANSDDKKFFDVAKPKEVKPTPSSRPIIVGHKPVVKDPMMADTDTAVADNESPKREVTLGSLSEALEKDAKTAPLVKDEPQAEQPEVQEPVVKLPKRKKIIPLSQSREQESVKPEAEVKAAEESLDESAPVSPEPETPAVAVDQTEQAPVELEAEDAAVDESAAAPGPTSEEEASSAENQPAAEPDPDQADGGIVEAVADQAKLKQEEKRQAEEEAAMNEAIEKLVNDKTYFLPIGEAKRRRSSLFAVVIVLMLLIIVSGVYLAVDAGFLDVGIDVPYDLIKQ